MNKTHGFLLSWTYILVIQELAINNNKQKWQILITAIKKIELTSLPRETAPRGQSLLYSLL